MIKFAVITISDRSSRGERPDASGPALVSRINQQGWSVEKTSIIPDEIEQIKNCLIEWCDAGIIDVLLTTGGTGFAPRDVTPEATLAIIQKSAPGIAEVIRQESLKTTPHAMLSRAVAGIRGKTLIINLPGSPRGAVESLEVVIPVLQHAVDLLSNNPTSEKGHQTTA